MTRRTSPRDSRSGIDGAALEFVVRDKRVGWRAADAKARRRQRRYKKLLIGYLPLTDDVEHLNDDRTETE